MRPGFSLDQLRADADAVAASPHRAFKDIAHAKLAPDLLHVDRLAFVGEARISRDDEQPADAAERGDDLLDHSVGEILLLRIPAQIGERQHGDRRARRWAAAAARA